MGLRETDISNWINHVSSFSDILDLIAFYVTDAVIRCFFRKVFFRTLQLRERDNFSRLFHVKWISSQISDICLRDRYSNSYNRHVIYDLV